MDGWSSEENLLLECLMNDDDSMNEDMDFLLSSSSEDSNMSEVDEFDSSSDENVVERRNLIRVRNYVEEIIPLYDDIEFKEHFRMSRATSRYIIDLIKAANILPNNKFGRTAISAEKSFYMTTWYLANQESYRQICDKFDVTKSTAHSRIKLIVKFFVSISNKYIKWPNAENCVEISKCFNDMQKINGVIGAIDGSHIKILRPQKDQHVYCNRKGDHSILLQGVCDHKKRFIDIFCGEAGSIHDARLLKRSKLYEQISEGKIIHNDYFLLGDSAYPSLTWLVPPFKDNGRLTENQKLFNFRHSSTRIIIENAFGLLKGRFRRLKNFENRNIQFVSEAVVSACVLHNICIDLDDLEIEYEQEQETNEVEDCNLINETDFDRRQQVFHEMFN